MHKIQKQIKLFQDRRCYERRGLNTIVMRFFFWKLSSFDENEAVNFSVDYGGFCCVFDPLD